jgi:hypothetical protein
MNEKSGGDEEIIPVLIYSLSPVVKYAFKDG